MEEVRRDLIEIEGGEIPITLSKASDESSFLIKIDGVEWVNTENKTHAVVLFELMKDHITEYMQYKKI